MLLGRHQDHQLVNQEIWLVEVQKEAGEVVEAKNPTEIENQGTPFRECKLRLQDRK